MPASVLSRQTILEQFHTYGCPRERFLIGGEYERAIVHKSGKSVSYDEMYGIRWFLNQFAERWGWSKKHEGNNVIALYKDNANITLEPGGQFEISGKPHRDLQTLVAEFEENRDCLVSLAHEANLEVITAGLTPITAVEDIGWMPKGRYAVMREYLPQQGDLAHYMMKGTTSVQCNYDFIDEADCAQKVRLASALAPLTTAIFANSPLYKNTPTGFQSFRGHIWTRTDPDRTGFPPGLREDFTFERWVDYLLNVPMMFIKRGDDWIHAKGKSFAHFIQHGVEGHFPNWDDWELHMTSTFPEVRIKRTIEVRGADCVSHDLALAFCALFTGLFYDDAALSQGLALAEEVIQYGTREERFNIACRNGLHGSFHSTGHRIEIAEVAQRMVSIALDGLSRYQPHNQYLLEPLVKQVASGCSPAENLLQFWNDNTTPEAIVQYLAY